MNIIIKTIPNKEQRYRTIGDYWFDENGDIQIRVSELKDWRWELLVALHELVEVSLCKDRGIPEPLIAEFDKKFESNRPENNEDEPGDDVNAPYKKEHHFATCIERLMALEFKIDWPNYHYDGLED